MNRVVKLCTMCGSLEYEEDLKSIVDEETNEVQLTCQFCYSELWVKQNGGKIR